MMVYNLYENCVADLKIQITEREIWQSDRERQWNYKPRVENVKKIITKRHNNNNNIITPIDS